MTWQNQQSDCAPSKDSDQPVHPPSLIRVSAVRMKTAWVLSYPLSAQRRLLSDWADAQADLSLRWAHSHFCWFCHVSAHLVQTLSSENILQCCRNVNALYFWPYFVSNDSGFNGKCPFKSSRCHSYIYSLDWRVLMTLTFIFQLYGMF